MPRWTSPARLTGLCILALGVTSELARAAGPCPAHPNPPDTCPLPNIRCFCCGTCDTELAAAGPCWELAFLDGGNKCDPQDEDGGRSGADGTDYTDFDGDGDMDVVTGFEEGGGIQVYLNPTIGGGDVRQEWPKVNVDGGVSIVSIEDASFADLNGDCLADAVVSSMEGSTDKVCIHFYVGPNRLAASILNEANWQGECLQNQNKNYMRSRFGQLYPRTVAAADNLPASCDPQNPPGCNDIVVGAKVDGSNDGETLLWYECPGASGTDPNAVSQGLWTRRLIGRGEFFMSVELVDLDGDDDLDVLFSDRQRVGWFQNPYDSNLPLDPAGLARIRGEWARHVIEGPGSLPGEVGPYPESPDSRWLTYYDLDDDEDTDIVTTVNYDMRDCPNNSGTTCTGGSHDNPGIRIVAHWYEARRIQSAVRPTEGVSFSLGNGWWLNYLRHVVAANDLPFRDEDTPEPPDTWASKAVAAGDIFGGPQPELVLNGRGSGHGIYALASSDPRLNTITFLRPGQGASPPLQGQTWQVKKLSSAYLNRAGVSDEDDGRKMKYDNIQLVDLDGNGSLDALSSEENAGPESKGLGSVWYRNPCGDGLLDPGEACDLGASNGSAGACCSQQCRFISGTVCRPATDLCDAAEVCSGASAACPPDGNASAGTPCGPPEQCSPDACDGFGSCVSGAGPGCVDDGNPCTNDVCDNGVCLHPPKPDGLLCPDDDGNACTRNECLSGICTAIPQPGQPCTNDGNDCTNDVCDAAGTCAHPHKANGTSCEITGLTCAVGVCDAGSCDAVPAPQGTPCPDDGNECTLDVCNGVTFGCTHGPGPEGIPCGDSPDPGNPCELQNVCSALYGGICMDLSNAGQVCRPAQDECDRPEVCTIPQLTEGVSVCPQDAFAPQITCTDDGNDCTWDQCDGLGNCTHPVKADGELCAGGECTSNTCQGGECTHVPTPGVPCTSDANYCTQELCNAAGACGSVPLADGTSCSPLDWDDRECTDDVCLSGACAHPPKPAGTSCGWWGDDACDDPDSCDGAGECLENHLPDGAACVSDGQLCTRDVCDSGVCAHVPIDQSLLPNGLCGFELSPLGDGIPGPQVDPRGVQDFAVFDGGSGRRLYATGWVGFGQFDQVCLVEWNGSNWAATGGGFDCTGEALAVYDDGSGFALYVGGLFYPSQPYYHLARWNGVNWTNVDPGLNDQVKSLVVFDDGGGPALYAGGVFTQMGATPANYVVKWDGQDWVPVGTLADSSGGGVFELAVVDLGTGPKLYAGGQFDQAGGSSASGIAVLDAGEWTPLGQLAPVLFWPSVHAITSFNSGFGPQLYIGGSFAVYEANTGYSVAKWTGAGWEAIGQVQPPNTAAVFSLFEYDDGTGNALYAGGSFSGIDAETSPFAIRYDGGSWQGLRQCLSAYVSAFTAFDDGTGESLILGGGFRDAGGPDGDRVARWACTGDNDCNDNLVPDELDPDCDGNGVPDDCDLAAGTSTDANSNGTPDECETGAPSAIITFASSRKLNPGSSGGVCDLPLVPGVKSESRQGGATELRIAFDVAPGGPGDNPITIEQATCPAPPSYGPYTGSAVIHASVVGNELVLTLNPGLENLRTYRLNIGPSVTSIPGQLLEVRGLIGDVNSDGFVNAVDRAFVVGAWTSPAGFTCATDLNSSGATNAVDRAMVVGAWTAPSNCAP